MGSFRVSKRDAERTIEEYLKRRRSQEPPEINFPNMGKGPEVTKMPKFQSDRSSHAPLIPEDKDGRE